MKSENKQKFDDFKRSIEAEKEKLSKQNKERIVLLQNQRFQVNYFFNLNEESKHFAKN